MTIITTSVNTNPAFIKVMCAPCCMHLDRPLLVSATPTPT